MIEELILADTEQTEMALRIFGEYPTMTPEEWAARFAHRKKYLSAEEIIRIEENESF